MWIPRFPRVSAHFFRTVQASIRLPGVRGIPFAFEWERGDWNTCASTKQQVGRGLSEERERVKHVVMVAHSDSASPAVQAAKAGDSVT